METDTNTPETNENLVDIDNLIPGDQFYTHGELVEVLGLARHGKDWFGREEIRYNCKIIGQEDKSGDVVFGAGIQMNLKHRAK